MKNIFFVLLVFAVAVSCNDSDTKVSDAVNATETSLPGNPMGDSANYTSIQWIDSIQQNLGKINEGQTPEISWRFKNVGDKPLVIMNAQGTCGCTVAEKPEQPVAPGEEGVIKAKFSSEGRTGFQEKQVIVTTNTKGNTAHYLNFKVEVQKQ